ncbi:MAG: hypothetical protein M0Z75_01935, partial [Nitrospiraceae bacterium]|nr:hypothetical protein [Nitrospiraceae bacterium]
PKKIKTMRIIKMRIDCYVSPGCGSEEALRENIRRALALEEARSEVEFHSIDNEKALALGLTGSPSVLINGEQLQPQERAGFS